MRATDFKRSGCLLQIQTVIDHRLWIADTPPACNRKRTGVEESRRDVQAAHAITRLGPLISAENQEVDTAGNHVDGKDTHALSGIDHENQFPLTTQTAH